MSRIDLNSTGVYKIQNIIDGKIYIGSTENSFKARWKQHEDAFKIGKNSRYLQFSYDKYGKENFIFVPLFECDPEECLEWEQFFFDLYQPWPETDEGYNICKIAGNTTGCTHSEETKLKISEKVGKRSYFFVSPEGKLVEGKNLAKFCKDSKLSYGSMYKVLTGDLHQHKGWTNCLKNYLMLKTYGSVRLDFTKPTPILNPDGELVYVFNRNKFYRENFNSEEPGIFDFYNFLNGKVRSFRGWTRHLKDHKQIKKYGNLRVPNVNKYVKNEEGLVVKIFSVNEFCAEFNLQRSSVSALINKRKEKYRGWILSSEEEYKNFCDQENYQQ
jgi:group I intron endonuclease